MIELKNLSKTYGDRVIFKNLNLQVAKGTFLWVYGKSGAGKSTLLNIIGMLDSDYEGDITILGKENPYISKDGQNILRTNLSYLFQNYGLIENETVFYNLNIVEKIRKNKNKKARMESILKFLDLDHVDLKQYVYMLSGGEQQRVALAKIIAKNPKIILCDEPTGSLDNKNAIKVMDTLKYLNEKGTTIIIVSHDNIVEKYVSEKIEI